MERAKVLSERAIPLGRVLINRDRSAMSALPPKAAQKRTLREVRFGPQADILRFTRSRDSIRSFETASIWRSYESGDQDLHFSAEYFRRQLDAGRALKRVLIGPL